MLKKQQINELQSIIEYLNQTENPKKEDIQNRVEDLELFLKVLSRVKISKVKCLFDKSPKRNSQVAQHLYTKEEVLQLFFDSDVENIIKNYSLSQLKAMFITIYEKNPLSKAKKEDIADAIEKMLRQIERTEGFK